MRRAAIALVLAASAVVGAAPTEDVAKQDAQKLQGAWKAVSVEDGGKKRPDDHIKDWVLLIEGERMTAKDRDETLDQSTFKLDPSKKPAAIAITYTSGPDKGKTLHGIYAVEGDALKICVAFDEKETPKEFVSKQGTDQTLVVLKRDKGGK